MEFEFRHDRLIISSSFSTCRVAFGLNSCCIFTNICNDIRLTTGLIMFPQIPLSNTALSALNALLYEFALSLILDERDLVASAYQLMDRVSQGTRIPRRAQIDFMLGIKRGRDVVIRVRTGFRKTVAIVLVLVACGGIGILISLLKLLQATQVCNKIPLIRFHCQILGVQVNKFKAYGVEAVVINEDTPNDSGLWKVCTLFYHIYLLPNEYYVDYHHQRGH